MTPGGSLQQQRSPAIPGRPQGGGRAPPSPSAPGRAGGGARGMSSISLAQREGEIVLLKHFPPSQGFMVLRLNSFFF